MKKTTKYSVGAAAVALLATLHPSLAQASGLYFTDRGVRPLGRGGAFVAGADDLGATWYNPAGLADAGNAMLADFTWLDFRVNYTQQISVANAEGTVYSVNQPTVNGNSPFIPLPTLAMSLVLDKAKRVTIAGGLLAPYIALASYPTTVGGQPSPARYALGSFSGSLLALPGLWMAYKPIEQLRFGLGAMALAGYFQSTITFSASPQDRLLAPPFDPSLDANAKLKVGPIVAPTLVAGITAVPHEMVRIGVSGQLPMVISAPATIGVVMPTDVVFDSARQDGNRAHVKFSLPAIFRAGVEVRPIDGLRVEVSYIREFWGVHRTIDATPEGMTIDGIQGLPNKVALPPIVIPREFQSSDSFRLGGEYHLPVGPYALDFRAGCAYETTAVPPAYLSLSSLDFDKLVTSVGGGLYVGKSWRFDALYSHVFAGPVTVAPASAKIPQINPLNGNAPFTGINGGRYSAVADLFGVGANFLF